ncbi:MAG TPA: ABC transporter permease [Candidatus Saccharimonadales bacterium]|nr:ABC transporter permease [Candidatus Saccharimonadales bacterium]
MNYIELLRLAWVALVANKLRSMLTTLGIIIGVFAIILLVSIGTGLQTSITGQISGLGSNLIFVVPGNINGQRSPGGVLPNKLVLNDAKNLSLKLKEIAYVAPAVQQTTTIKYKNKSNKNTTILGTSASYPQVVKTDMLLGNFFSTAAERSGSKVAVIGTTVQTNLFNDTDPIGKQITIGSSRYRIIGVAAKKGSIFGVDRDNSVAIPITIAQRQFGFTNVSTIYMAAKKPELVPVVKEQAKNVLLRRLTIDDFTLQTQEDTLSTVNTITNTLTIALGGIAAISLLVGGIGVANIMLVSVTERTKEIGLRKALGAKREDILKQFLLEAIILSLTGGTIGILLGMGASIIASRFLQTSVTLWSVALAFGFSVAVGVIFGMAPAIRASRLSPIDALRYE